MNPTIQAVRTALNEPLKSERVCREVVLAVLRSVREPSEKVKAQIWAHGEHDPGVHVAMFTGAIDALIAELTP